MRFTQVVEDHTGTVTQYTKKIQWRKPSLKMYCIKLSIPQMETGNFYTQSKKCIDLGHFIYNRYWADKLFLCI